MKPFITDLLVGIHSGFIVNGIVFKIEIVNMVCDAPAKAFLLNVKQFNSYSGCNSCTEERTFFKIESLKTNESFRNKIDDDYHKGNSPLELLPINIVDTVCIDNMHNCCLGVMKRLLEL